MHLIKGCFWKEFILPEFLQNDSQSTLMVSESGLTIMACCNTEDVLSLSRRELNPIGSRALSHDSIFIPEEPVTEPHLEHSMSQENVSDKVRNLQVSLVVVV